jgi:N,N-dimethylformamidase beta subunit-like, C-terminal
MNFVRSPTSAVLRRMETTMERREVLTRIGRRRSRAELLQESLKMRWRRAEQCLNVYEPNFGLLASDSSWRSSWSAIIAGRFSSSPFSGLLFVEHSTAYAELYDTDGNGRIRAPFRRQYNPLGERTTWSHIIPGIFGPSGFTGLLLYDRAAGVGRFYDSNGQGDFVLRSKYTGWRTSWTHIVAGRFVASSPYSSVFFYSASENYGEIWATDGKGLVGTAPLQTFPDFWESTFTDVVAGDFHWTPGYIDAVPTLTDLFFYDAVTGHGEMYRCDKSQGAGGSSIVLISAAMSDGLPRHVTSVVAGNFGGFGNTDLAFYDGSAGTLSFYSFQDVYEIGPEAERRPIVKSANLVLRETQSGLRRTATNLLVSGNFWMSNLDDHWFGDGPPVYRGRYWPFTGLLIRLGSKPRFDPDWRFGTGAFSDLLLYDRAAGLGEFYFHEPLSPLGEPLEGYVTSRSSQYGARPVSTGSVLPGESIAFHVSSQSGPYSITIYRQGVFADGTTEERMATIDGLPANPTPFLIARNAYKNGAQWPAVATFVVPDWPSGLYFARVQTTGTPSFTIDLPFVVRAPPGPRAGVLLVLADTTYYAYNDWGGRNSYGHVSGSDFAGAFPSASAFRIPFGFQLSFDRPFHGGFGNSPQTREIPFIQWLARWGIPFDVCTSRDVHFQAPSARDHRLVVFVGHHEYWTAKMRTHVETFAKSGGNVAFFSGNVCWWQIRLSTDGRQLVCYKVAGFDPVSTTSDHALTTVHWFDDLVKRPETTLTGVSWLGEAGAYSDQDHRFQVKRADHWVFAGTGLRNGDKFGGYSSTRDGEEDRSVAGSETDRVQSGEHGLKSPPNYTLASIYDLFSPDFEVGTMGTFRPAGESGVVFNAATTDWALGLSYDKQSWNAMDQISLNVITRLGLAWTSVSDGQSTPGAPVTAVLTGQDRITLFLANPNGGIYTTSGFGTNWDGWGTVSEGRSTPGAPVTAVLTGQDRITLFLANPNGGIYTSTKLLLS